MPVEQWNEHTLVTTQIVNTTSRTPQTFSADGQKTNPTVSEAPKKISKAELIYPSGNKTEAVSTGLKKEKMP